ncbi:MAG: hypothetical protein M3068_10990 [Gemmatimonadota bacterium]|nr:hypothetical protein [Gemmatimonadota bacterium]
MDRRFALLSLALLVQSGSCVSARRIDEAVPGALQFSFPDSARYVLDAAAYAITDEGLSITQKDATRMLVESGFVDIGTLRARSDRSAYTGPDRMIKFRFRTRTTFGATILVGEAVYRPNENAGRAGERMVPESHAAREVLTRMFAGVGTRLSDERARRSQPPPQARPPGAM